MAKQSLFNLYENMFINGSQPIPQLNSEIVSDLDVEEIEVGYDTDYFDDDSPEETEDNNIDDIQLQIGIEVEKEHVNSFLNKTSDLDEDTIARTIATDHLKANPNYYTILIEAGLVDESEAINIYNEHYGNNETKSEDNYSGNPENYDEDAPIEDIYGEY